jgi:uncharacterized membrane protein
MTILIIGVFLFGGSHLFSVLLPPVRNRLRAWLGEARFKGLYSLVSAVGLGMMFWGYALTRLNGEMLYIPSPGARHITMLLVLLGFICMSAPYGSSHIRKWLQNPFSIGICLWSIGHLIANGKTSVVLIYLTFLVVSAFDIINNMARGNKPMFEPHLKSDVVAVLAGLLIYALMLFIFHPYVLGVKISG